MPEQARLSHTGIRERLDSPLDYENLAAAQAFLADGQNLLEQGEFISAVQAFQDAFRKADAVIS